MSRARAAVAVAAALAAWWVGRRLTAAPRTPWSPSAGRLVDGPLPSRVLGDGEPSLLLLHGMFGSGRYWGRAYDELAGGGSVVAPDLLGFGGAPRPPGGYTSQAHADAVAASLRRLDAGAPLTVGAHSVGCLVALRLAVLHPELVADVAAFAPPIHRSPASARRQLAKVDPLARVVLLDADLGARLCALMCRHRTAAALLVRLARPALPPALAHDRVEHSWASYSETLSSLVLSAEAQDWLAATNVPIHLVVGSGDDVVDLPFLEELARRYDHVTLEIVDGAGHDLPLTHQQRCVEILRRRLQVRIAARG